MEQYVRDARISMIYEGTNGVQALDLVGRKLPANSGRLLRQFFGPASAFIEAHAQDSAIGTLVRPFAQSLDALEQATDYITRQSANDPEEGGAAAADYLRMFGLVALGFMWVRMAKIAADAQSGLGDDAAFYRAKRATATFFIERLLPQAGSLLNTIKAGKASMMALAEEAF